MSGKFAGHVFFVLDINFFSTRRKKFFIAIKNNLYRNEKKDLRQKYLQSGCY